MKEILTILVGLLGTIVGFYFGSAIEENAGKLNIAEPILSTGDVVKSQGLITLTSFISGGIEPYHYKKMFPDIDCINVRIRGRDHADPFGGFASPTAICLKLQSTHKIILFIAFRFEAITKYRLGHPLDFSWDVLDHGVYVAGMLTGFTHRLPVPSPGVDTYTRAAQRDELSAESSFRLLRVGGNMLGILN